MELVAEATGVYVAAIRPAAGLKVGSLTVTPLAVVAKQAMKAATTKQIWFMLLWVQN